MQKSAVNLSSNSSSTTSAFRAWSTGLTCFPPKQSLNLNPLPETLDSFGVFGVRCLVSALVAFGEV